MTSYVVTEAPHFVTKDSDLRVEEKRELFREYDTLLRFLLCSSNSLEVTATSDSVNGQCRINWAYHLPKSEPHFENLQRGLRYIRLHKNDCVLRPAKDSESFVQRHIRLIRIGGDKIMQNRYPRIMGWIEPEKLDYGALIPLPQPITFSQSDYRWRNLLQAMGENPESSVRISIKRLEPNLNDMRYAYQCSESFSRTYGGKLSIDEIDRRMSLYNQIITNEYLYEVRIVFFQDSSESLRLAFIKDTDLEAFSFQKRQFSEPQLNHLDNELRAVICRYFSLWHLDDLIKLIFPPYSFLDALSYIPHFVPKPFIVPSFENRPANENKIFIGSLEDGTHVHIPTKSLTRHTFVTGKTGAGKSTTIRNIVEQVIKQDIPVLIIDPIKVDYEELMKRLGYEANIIDVSADRIRFNLFIPAHNITLYAHSTIVAKALSLLCPTTPIAYELWLSMVRKCYLGKLNEFARKPNPNSKGNSGAQENTLTLNDMVLTMINGSQLLGMPDAIPIFSDLKDIGLQWLTSLPGEGTEWLKDAITYFERRFEIMQGSLLKQIFTPSDKRISIFPLFQSTYLIELYQILDETEANAIFAMILALLFEYRLSEGPKDECVHLTVVEELHRLAPSNPRAFGKEVVNSPEMEIGKLLSRALGELRDRGEALVVGEQSSMKIFADAMINTVTRIIHGVSYGPDIENISQALSLSSRERDHLSYLRVNREGGYSEAIAMLPDLAQPLYLRIKPSFSAGSG